MHRFWLILSLLVIILVVRVLVWGGLDQTAQLKTNSQDQSSALVTLRTHFSDQIKQLLPEPQASLLTGMVLGLQSNLEPHFKRALQNTSTIHVVVVSGQNLTLVAGFIISLSQFLGRRKTLALSVLVAVSYAILTGFQIPAIRACIMVGIASVGKVFDREVDSLLVLVIAGLGMLIYNPSWLYSISFQLSFLATVGVIAVAPDLIKQDLAVSIAAQALTWPVIAANFHQFSLVGVLTNGLIL